MSRTPSQEKQTSHKRTPLPPSMLDQMEAMVRHPEFRRLLFIWQSIFSKNYVGLTVEEELERNAAPRTRFQVAAMMEADGQWLSRSIQDIRQRDEEAWNFDAVQGPFGDRAGTVTPIVPAYLSQEAIQQWVGQIVRQERKQSGIKPIQNPRNPTVDKWTVYDLMQEKNATPATVRDRLCGPYGRIDRRFTRRQVRLSAQDKKRVKYDLERVRRAYHKAEAMIARLDSPQK